jgi:kynurenine 3-monooxygenase
MSSKDVPDIEGNRKFRICIVGAGLAGSMMACMLGKLNYTVSVYEKREDPRAV